MKSLMRSYVYWHNRDKDIESLVKSSKRCALAAKAPPIKFKPWLETDHPWSSLYIDFASPLNGSYYLIIIDSFSKVARDCEMQETNHGSSNWVSTQTVCEVRGSRFYCFGQCHPIYIKRIQGIMQNVCGGAHNNCPLPPKKQQPSRMVHRYLQEGPKNIQERIHRGSIARVSTSVLANTK